ncbi:MAG: 6-bladed beta-propeller [Thermomicrobiales bacterium]
MRGDDFDRLAEIVEPGLSRRVIGRAIGGFLAALATSDSTIAAKKKKKKKKPPACVPSCNGKVCGGDGCGGQCKPGCTGNTTCSSDGRSCQCRYEQCGDTCCDERDVCQADNPGICCTRQLEECPAGACGAIGDGCGRTLACGGCSNGFTCTPEHDCVCLNSVVCGSNPPVCCPVGQQCVGATCQPPATINYVWQWTQPHAVDRFPEVHSIVIDAAAYTIVTDRAFHRLLRFTPQGDANDVWGEEGRCGRAGDPPCNDPATAGRFFAPLGIVRTADNHFLVVDSGNARIQELSDTGAPLTQWGTSGSNPGQFQDPAGIAIDSAGAVFVADRGNNRIQKFTRTGTHLASFGAGGAQPLQSPAAVAVAADGAVYAAEASGIVKVYRPSAANPNSYGLNTTIGAAGSGNGQFRGPVAIAVDNAHLFVADSGNTRIQKFRLDTNQFVVAWGSEGGGSDQFNTLSGITLNGATVYTADSGAGRIQGFRPDGASYVQSKVFDAYPSQPARFWEPHGLAVHSEGTVVADSRRHRIQIRNFSGSFIRGYGIYGPGAGSFKYPTGVVCDANGNLYVVERDNHRVQKLSPQGVSQALWGQRGSGASAFDSPLGIAIDAAGEYLYVADTGNNRIQKVGTDGAFTARWGSSGSAAAQLTAPTGVAVHGNLVFVTDTGNNRVQVYSANGDHIRSWGGAGNGPGDMNQPAGIAVDVEGHVFVVDAGRQRVQKFTPEGQLLAYFGAEGVADGFFRRPFGIAVDADGNVTVGDVELHRLQQWYPEGGRRSQAPEPARPRDKTRRQRRGHHAVRSNRRQRSSHSNRRRHRGATARTS